MTDDDRIVATIGDVNVLDEVNPRFLARRIVRFDATDNMMGIDGPESSDDGPIVVPMLAPPSGQAMAIPEPEAKPKAGASPKPAVPRKEAWALGGGRYILQSGDTFWGLGVTYLGSGPRWREIRAIQTDAWKAKNPDPGLIRAGDVILMPKEAEDRARQLGVLANVAGFKPNKVVLSALASAAAAAASYFFGSNS